MDKMPISCVDCVHENKNDEKCRKCYLFSEYQSEESIRDYYECMNDYYNGTMEV